MNCESVVHFLNFHPPLFMYGDLHLPIDIPECVRGLDECDMNATCINTVGSYDCMCNTGFTGNGFSCTGDQQ